MIGPVDDQPAFNGHNEDERSHAWDELFGFVDELKTQANTEQLLGLEEFLARVKQWRIGADLDDIRLAFNADDIKLAEWFDSFSVSTERHTDVVNEPESGLFGFSGQTADGKTLIFNLDEMRVFDLLMAGSSGSLFAGVSDGSPEVGPQMSQVFDMDRISFLDALAS